MKGNKKVIGYRRVLDKATIISTNTEVDPNAPESYPMNSVIPISDQF